MKNSELRSELAKVRGHGSAHDGTSHFLWQRITAIVLIPLTLWFVWSLLGTAIAADQDKIIEWLSSGLNVAALIIMLLALFYHAKLGVQVIIEDYVHCPAIKISALLANLLIMFAFAVISILAVLKLHFHLLPGATG
jgi:succinate dehydrogenase / fumarate reductase membrane anchor subunit